MNRYILGLIVICSGLQAYTLKNDTDKPIIVVLKGSYETQSVPATSLDVEVTVAPSDTYTYLPDGARFLYDGIRYHITQDIGDQVLSTEFPFNTTGNVTVQRQGNELVFIKPMLSLNTSCALCIQKYENEKK